MSFLSPTTLFKAEALFRHKQWSLAPTYVVDNPSIFEKFCSRLKLFDQHLQDFIIEFSYNFVTIPLGQYLERFYASFLELGEEFLYTDKKIFVYPLISPFANVNGEERIARPKTKSSEFLYQLFVRNEYRWITTKIIEVNRIEDLQQKFDNDNSLLVLIDDYIGSGLTAVDVCNSFLDPTLFAGKISPESIRIVTIAAQSRGIDYIHNTLGIRVVSSIILERGINDFYKDADLDENIKKMEIIEERLRIRSDYNFGYERTEGMISFLNKTPNNTFPLYWANAKKSLAPFPRYQ